MGCLLALSPYIAAVAVALLLLPVNSLLAIVASTAVWYVLSTKIWGGGSGSGDGRYNDAGGPYDVD